MALADLVTIAEVEAVIGRRLSAADRVHAETIIADVSAAIRRDAGHPLMTQVSVTVTMQADSNGIIELRAKPIMEISSVKDPMTGNDVQNWLFDGIELLYVSAQLIVEVTYRVSVAWAVDEVRAVAKAMAVRQIINPDGCSGRPAAEPR